MNFTDHFEDEDPGLNLTPMIDVVFLLLIFFMLATTFMDPEKDVNLDLPSTSDGGSSSDEIEEIIVNVMVDGSFIVNGEVMDENGMLAKMSQASAQDPETQVTIRGDRQTAYENVVQVMDYAMRSGLSNLSVATIVEG